MTITKDDKFLRFQRADMRLICQRILQDITFMAEHNLMDYSLLMITERNLDYKEEDKESVLSTNRLKKSNSDAHTYKEKAEYLKRMPSGIPEVEEDEEDDSHSELKRKLRESADLDTSQNTDKSHRRIQTTALPK